jgi:hypothetical protein
MKCPNCESASYYRADVVLNEDRSTELAIGVGFCTDCYAVQDTFEEGDE